MRKLAGTVIAVVVAAVGVIGLIAFFDARDASTTTGTGARPSAGRPAPVTGAAGLLAGGNIVLRFSDRSFAPRLKGLAADLGAPDSPELRAAGQAVVLRPQAGVGGVVAEAYRRRLVVSGPSDPQLRSFIERWLGAGASG